MYSMDGKNKEYSIAKLVSDTPMRDHRISGSSFKNAHKLALAMQPVRNIFTYAPNVKLLRLVS